MPIELQVILGTWALVFGGMLVAVWRVLHLAVAQLELLHQTLGRLLLNLSEVSARMRQLEDRAPAPVCAPKRGRKS